MKPTPASHFRKVLFAFENLNHVQLKPLLRADIYNGVPVTDFLFFLQRILLNTRTYGDKSLLAIPCSYHGEDYHPRAQYFKFYASKKRVNFAVGFVVEANTVIDILLCTEKDKTTINGPDPCQPTQTIDLNIKELQESCKKNLKIKSADVYREWFLKLERGLVTNGNSDDPLAFGNYCYDFITPWYEYIVYNSICLRSTRSLRMMHIYKANAIVNCLDGNREFTMKALKEIESIRTIEEMLNWLSYYEHLYFKLDVKYDAQKDEYALAKYPILKWRSNSAKNVFRFLKKYEDIQNRCWQHHAYQKTNLYTVSFQEEAKLDAKKPTLLICNDIDEALKTIGNALSALDYNCILCRDGKEGLKVLRSVKVDVLIAKLKMPKISGPELIDICAEEFPMLPIIAINTYMEESEVEEMMQENQCEVIDMPFAMPELMNRIQSVLKFN